MRYCTQCRHLTPGEPLFCNVCGRTYDVRLCPRLHVNPRSAQLCSQCGSRDLSRPQPPTTFVNRLSMTALRLLPLILLGVISLAVLLAFVEAVLTNAQVQGQLLAILLLLGACWWAYMQLPSPVRSGISRLVRRNKGDGGRHH